jgi:SWI/SNF-related matrix-associated actin-dependent regulator 1 of chromatin subfamily A
MARTAKIIKTNTIRLTFAFNRELVERVKKLSNRRWAADVKAWDVTVDYRNCFELERIITEEKFIYGKEELNTLTYFKAEAKDLAQGNIKPAYQLLLPPERVKNAMQKLGFSIRPYQIEGFSAMVHFRKAINGCEMGLGKTLQTLMAIEYADCYPALIICPASLKFNWNDEIVKFLPGRTTMVLDSKEIAYAGKDFYIINYDNLLKRKKDLEKINFKCVACDESHYIKNKKAQRSTAANAMIKKVPYAYLLSGTMIENRPDELISQIEAIERLSDLGGYWTYINRYCDAKSNGFGLDTSGAKNIQELFLRMSKLFYFRKNKADVLTDLPPKIYNTIHVEIKNRKEYNQAEKNLVTYLQHKALSNKQIVDMAKNMAPEEADTFIEQILQVQEDKVNSAEHLVLMTTLRKITAQGKIEAAQEWVNNFLESSNEKILVFAWHTEVVVQMAQRFGCDSIHGGVEVNKRKAIVDKFQNDPQTRILVLNIKAGGVGLNLTKSSTVLFIEEPFNPALKMQAEDRAHRIGQKDTVNIYTMVARNTIDEDVRELVESKLEIINGVNAGKFTENTADLDVTKELIKKLKEK